MAKAKTRRTGGRKAASPKRATSPAKSKKSTKRLKKRAKSIAKTQRAGRKGVRRQAAAGRPRSSARAKAKRRTVVKRSAKKAVARRSSARRPAARRVAAKPLKKAAAPASKPARSVKRVVTLVARKTTAAPRPTAARVAPKSPPMPPTAPAPARVTRRAAGHAKPPALERQRRHLPEADVVPSPPSSLDLNRTASAARSGQAEIAEHLADHTETGPEITAGDVDASWESAYSTGDEAPGGDNPTPDQDIVDDIGKSLGVVYEDTEELKGADKITERDKHRWELDPASAEDFKDR